jgi:hypothetical protein
MEIFFEEGNPMRVRDTPQQRFLLLYSAIVTLAFMGTVYAGFIRPMEKTGKTAEFDRIRVHRIDVVERDGTPRLIIADRAEFPGSFFHGHEIVRASRNDSAGMLFVNDEGTEDGGLIYAGSTKDGQRSSFSHLSFDQYEQDQTVVIGTSLSPGGEKRAGIELNDMPDQPITPALIAEAERIKALPQGSARGAAWAAFQRTFPSGQPRASLVRAPDGSVGFTMNDKEGRARLRLTVAGDGAPTIQFLDDKGQVKREF